MDENKTENLEKTSLADKLIEHITGNWTTQAVYVAAELKIADHLAKGPKKHEELAGATGAHPHSLHRLLKALASIGICKEREDESFEITPMGSLLRTDAPGSLRSWTLWWGAYLWQVWGHLLYSVKTGESARTLLMGTEGFKHLENDQKAAAIFNEGLTELTRLTAENLVQAYDFSGAGKIVDIGGGHGELLIAILHANQSTSGILFDMPHAIEGAKQRLEKAGLFKRSVCIAGDFFEAVPSADTYLLKSIIHDWDDNNSKKILKNCRTAMKDGGRLLLIERIVPERFEISSNHQAIARTDLSMLAALAGKERTEKEFRQLLHAAGFDVQAVIAIGMTFSVIEAVPANSKRERR